MENGEILDGQITASSEFNANYGPANGRINFKAGGGRTGAWSSGLNDLSQWLQVDFELQATVTEIMIQGRSDSNQWVKSYAVTYSNGGVFYDAYQENGIIKVKTIFLIRVSYINCIISTSGYVFTGVCLFVCMFFCLFVCLFVCLSVCLTVARISQKVFDQCLCTFVEWLVKGQRPTH